jgi:transposase
MKIEILEKKQTSKEMLPQVLERIFAICKTDPEFPLKDKLESVEYVIENLNKKIKKKEYLYNQGKNLKENLETKFELITNSNLELREQILEALGSEL